MNLISKLVVHLDDERALPQVPAVQGDSARSVEVALFAGSQPWIIPPDTSVSIRYRRADGAGDEYDTLPDGSKAWSISGNAVTVAIDAAVLGVPGTAVMQIALHSGEKLLSIFSFQIHVQANPAAGTTAPGNPPQSGGGGKIELDSTLTQEGKAADAKATGDALNTKITAPKTAAIGQAMAVKAVDDDGYPTEWETVDFPASDTEGGGGSSVDTNALSKEVFDFARTATPSAVIWEQGYLNSKAVESNNANWYRSNFIEVDAEFDYTLFAKNGETIKRSIFYYFFNADKVLVGGVKEISLQPNISNTIQLNIKAADNVKYVRVLMPATMKNNNTSLVRLYGNQHLQFATKKEVKESVCVPTKNIISNQDYFGRNKKVVFIGDSITQGFGSTGAISYNTTDSDGNEISVKGNSPEYGQLHDLPTYEAGAKLYQYGDKVWYEAIDGKGWAHILKDYLQSAFGCAVKNYGMSGIASGLLMDSGMNSTTSDLLSAEEGTVRVYQGLTKGFDTVFIMVGTNDRGYASIDTYIYNLNYIVNQLINTDKKNVVLMSSIPTVSENKTLTMEQINGAIKDIATTHNVPFISLYDGMNDYCATTGIGLTTLVKADGIHPNDSGYEVMAAMIADALGVSLVNKGYVDRALANLPNNGASGSEEWELINEVIVTEECGPIVLTEDLNGNSFNLKKVYIAAKCYGIESATAAALLILNLTGTATDIGGKITQSNNGIGTATTPARCGMYVERVANTFYAISTPGYTGYDSTPIVGSASMNNLSPTYKFYDIAEINALCLWSNSYHLNATFGVGTTIKVYGVRV